MVVLSGVPTVTWIVQATFTSFPTSRVGTVQRSVRVIGKGQSVGRTGIEGCFENDVRRLLGALVRGRGEEKDPIARVHDGYVRGNREGEIGVQRTHGGTCPGLRRARGARAPSRDGEGCDGYRQAREDECGG